MDKDELIKAMSEMSDWVDYDKTYRAYDDNWTTNYKRLSEQMKKQQAAQKPKPPAVKSKPKVKWSRDVGHGLVDIINDL